MKAASVGPMPFYEVERQRRADPAAAIEWWGIGFVVVSSLIWLASFAAGFDVAIAVLYLCAFGATVAGFVMPAVGLYGIGVLATLDAIARFFLFRGGGLPWNTLNYWLLVMVATHAFCLLRFSPAPMRLLYAFMVVMGFQFLYSRDPSGAMQHGLGLFAILGLLIYFVRGTKNPRVWPWVGLINGTVGALGGLSYFIQKEGLPYINPNSVSYFPLTALFSVCLGFRFARGQQAKQLALLTLAVANGGWIFLTGSRGALIISLCCAVYLMRSIRNVSQKLVLGALAFLVGTFISVRFATMEEYTLGRIHRMFDSERELHERTSGRSDLAGIGFKMFLRYPWGVGTGNYGMYYARMSVAENSDFKPGATTAAHSGWIKVLAENGAAGFGLFAAFVGSFAAAGWRRRRFGVFPIGALVTSVLAVAFLSTEFQGKGLWFLAAGSLMIIYRRGMPEVPDGWRPRGRKRGEREVLTGRNVLRTASSGSSSGRPTERSAAGGGA